MTQLGNVDPHLYTFAHLLLPSALPEPFPIYWQVGGQYRLDAAMAFPIRHLLQPALRRAIGVFQYLNAVSPWTEKELFPQQDALRIWCKHQPIPSVKDALLFLAAYRDIDRSEMMDHFYALHGHALLPIIDELSYGYDGVRHTWLTESLLRLMASRRPKQALQLLQHAGDAILRQYGYGSWEVLYQLAKPYARRYYQAPLWHHACDSRLPTVLQCMIAAAESSVPPVHSWLDAESPESLLVAAWDFLSFCFDTKNDFLDAFISAIADKIEMPLPNKREILRLPSGTFFHLSDVVNVSEHYHYPDTTGSYYFYDRESLVMWFWLHALQDTIEWHIQAVTRLAQINAAARTYMMTIIGAVPKATPAIHAIARVLLNNIGLAAQIVHGTGDYGDAMKNLNALERFGQHLEDHSLRFGIQHLTEQLRAFYNLSQCAQHTAYRYVEQCIGGAYRKAANAQERSRVLMSAVNSEAFMQNLQGAVCEACLLHNNPAYSVDVAS